MHSETSFQFANLSALLGQLHALIEKAEQMNERVDFKGQFSCASANILEEKQHAADIAKAVWNTTGYRFTYVYASGSRPRLRVTTESQGRPGRATDVQAESSGSL
jgi:hypothetical protein